MGSCGIAGALDGALRRWAFGSARPWRANPSRVLSCFGTPMGSAGARRQRSATSVMQFLLAPGSGVSQKTRAVCPRHIPPSADYQKTRRLIKWAGGYDALQGLFMAEITRVRATVNDDALRAAIRETKIEPTTKEWWATYPFPWATFDTEDGAINFGIITGLRRRLANPLANPVLCVETNI